MRKFVFNGFSLTREKIFGIHRYALEILKELDRIVPQGSIQVVVPKGKEGVLKFDNIEIKAYHKVYKTKMSMFLWELFGFARYVKKINGISVDLTLTLPFKGSDVVAIHDCIQEKFPQNADSIKRKIIRSLYLKRVKVNLKRAKRIITVSCSSKKELINFYHCGDKTISIIPNSWQHFEPVRPDFSIIDKLALTEKQYFFSLGSRF